MLCIVALYNVTIHSVHGTDSPRSMARTLAQIAADLSRIGHELGVIALEHDRGSSCPHPPATDVVHLSVRHRAVLLGVVRGQSQRELARRLGISEQEIKGYVAEIQQALEEADDITITAEGLRA